MTEQPVRLAISMGDYNGIGPEVILKTFSDPGLLSRITPVVYGSEKVLRFYAECSHISPALKRISTSKQAGPALLNVIDVVGDSQINIRPGEIDRGAGETAVAAIKAAATACLNGGTDALITAPISKEAVHKAGFLHPGHTEFLAELCDTPDFVMLMVHKQLRVGLVSIHVPLHSVRTLITENAIYSKAVIIHNELINDFGVSHPKIAILGLNPHAGDGGVIGNEESEIIIPAITMLREKGIDAGGPFPADGFFGSRRYQSFDAVLAMYHDQGLAPFKTIAFQGGVNVTGGLPIIRTSPDHGTAFSIAGRNQADPTSFREAVDISIEIIHNRGKLLE